MDSFRVQTPYQDVFVSTVITLELLQRYARPIDDLFAYLLI